jgi:hypothetical protein
MLLVAAVAAILSVVTAQGAASAAGADTWDPRYPCTSGAFDLGSLTSQPAEPPMDQALTIVRLYGSLTCDVPVPGAKYALAVYPVGAAFGVVDTAVAVLPYEPTKDPQTFRVEGGISPQQGVAVCVASDVDLRIACVEVRVKMSGIVGSVSARSLAVSDPLVTRPLLISSRDVDPSCGTCWRMKKP